MLLNHNSSITSIAYDHFTWTYDYFTWTYDIWPLYMDIWHLTTLHGHMTTLHGHMQISTAWQLHLQQWLITILISPSPEVHCHNPSCGKTSQRSSAVDVIYLTNSDTRFDHDFFITQNHERNIRKVLLGKTCILSKKFKLASRQCWLVSPTISHPRPLTHIRGPMCLHWSY